MKAILQEVLQGKGAVLEPLEDRDCCISIRQCNDNLALGAQRETGPRRLGGIRPLWAEVYL